MSLSNPLDDILTEHSDPDMALAAIQAEIRRTTLNALNGALPLDVHSRYAAIRERQLAAVEKASLYIHLTLTEAKIDGVLAGAVGEKVKEGIAELTTHNDYTQGIASITR
jgi:hypothetical protein